MDTSGVVVDCEESKAYIKAAETLKDQIKEALSKTEIPPSEFDKLFDIHVNYSGRYACRNIYFEFLELVFFRIPEPVEREDLIPMEMEDNEDDYGYHTFDLENYCLNKTKPEPKAWHFKQLATFLHHLNREVPLEDEKGVCFINQRIDGKYNDYIQINFVYFPFGDNSEHYYSLPQFFGKSKYLESLVGNFDKEEDVIEIKERITILCHGDCFIDMEILFDGTVKSGGWRVTGEGLFYVGGKPIKKGKRVEAFDVHDMPSLVVLTDNARGDKDDDELDEEFEWKEKIEPRKVSGGFGFQFTPYKYNQGDRLFVVPYYNKCGRIVKILYVSEKKNS